MFIDQTGQSLSPVDTSAPVDPPTNIKIDDPGYLGLLDISWQPPASLNNSHCPARYELQYYNNEQQWKLVRMKEQTYRAAFDFGKTIDIKVRTYLKGACTNEKEVWSEWAGLSYLMPVQGIPESSVKHFHCINYNFETLKCEWNVGKLSNNSNYELQYWQEGMPHKKTCDTYMIRNGINIGCVFRSHQFEVFSDVFICVTGTPGLDPIRPSYYSFQTQNVGKPGSPEDVNITKTEANKLLLSWRPPKGKVPSHCLKYEIKFKSGTNSWKVITEEITKIINRPDPKYSLCVHIRAKTHIYCTNDGYWSDWSPETCWKDLKKKDKAKQYSGASMQPSILNKWNRIHQGKTQKLPSDQHMELFDNIMENTLEETSII
ncbi:interleukin-13 receptor subunit alpha-2 [Gastrophryne carolinensis]